MSAPEYREFNVTGAAMKTTTGGRRRGSTRKSRQSGGDATGALTQLTAQQISGGSVAGAGQEILAQINKALANVGPAQIQKGGDNKGALQQLASVPPMGAVGVDIPAEIQKAALVALKQMGPDHIQQFGGRKGQRGGDGIAGTIQLSSSSAPTLPGNVVTPVISGINPSQPAPVGGARLVLAPPKRRTRIALKAKKMRGGSEEAAKPIMGGAHHTRKARKIHLRVKGVTSRLAKAKKAKKQAMSAPISEVKARLESAGVIKKTSKAPESMLRTMYADLLITKKGL